MPELYHEKNHKGFHSFEHESIIIGWKNTTLKKEVSKEEVLELKQQKGTTILVGSPGLIVALLQLNLIDEYQLPFSQLS